MGCWGWLTAIITESLLAIELSDIIPCREKLNLCIDWRSLIFMTISLFESTRFARLAKCCFDLHALPFKVWRRVVYVVCLNLHHLVRDSTTTMLRGSFHRLLVRVLLHLSDIDYISSVLILRWLLLHEPAQMRATTWPLVFDLFKFILGTTMHWTNFNRLMHVLRLFG